MKTQVSQYEHWGGWQNMERRMRAKGRMGTYNKYLRMSYMNRNGSFEPMVRRDEQSIDATIAESISVIARRWKAGLPAVIGYHRQNAAMVDPADSDRGIDALDRFLS